MGYELIPSLYPWPRVKMILQNIDVVIQFCKSEKIESFDIYHKETANQIEVHVNRITKDSLFEFIKSNATKRNEGYKNEHAFENVLIVLKKEGFISEYIKSTRLEDMNQGFDWLIYYKNTKIKINIKSSAHGVAFGKKKDVIYLQFVHTSDLSYDLLHDIRQKIEKYHKAMVS